MKDSENFRKTAFELLNDGIVELFKKNYDESMAQIEQAQKLFVEANDTVNVAICLSELAIVQYKKSNLNLANSYLLLSNAGKMLKSIDHSSNIEAKICHYYGKLYYFEKQFTESLTFYAKALKIAEENGLEKAKIYDSMAIFYLRLNNHEISLRYLQKSLSIKTQINNNVELAYTKLLYGRYLLSIENYDGAEEHLNNALSLYDAVGFDSYKSRIFEELAKIYIHTETFDKAEIYCKKAINASVISKSKLLEAFSNTTFANLLAIKGENSNALDLINKASLVFKDLKVARGQALILQIQGLVNLNMHDYDVAIKILNDSVEIFKSLNLQKEIARGYFYIAKVYKERLEVQTSLGYTLEAMKIAKSNNFPILENKIEGLLFELVENELIDVTDNSGIKENNLLNSSSLFSNVYNLGDFSCKEKPQDPLISLLKIGNAIYNETDPDKILDIATKETQKAMNADRCSIFIHDKSKNELYSRIASGMKNQVIRFPSNVGMAGYVFNTGKLIKIDDAYEDPFFNKEIDEETGYKTKTILCIPMRNSSLEIIGVFQVINKLNNEVFTDEDLELLVSISSSVGASIENASLLKKQVLMYDQQKKSFNSFINALAASIDARDKITAGHSTRVTTYSLAIAEELNWNQEDKEVLEYSAILHDIGKLGVRDEILCKDGKLTDEEYKSIQNHAQITYDILNKMYFEEKFKKVPEIAACHHEKYNGKGYYKGLSGDNIPISSRIIAVADVFDAITSKRHYRDRMSFDEVLKLLKAGSGKHFDGKIIDEFFKINLSIIMHTLTSRYKDPISSLENIILSKSTINDLYLILNKKSDLTNSEKVLLDTFLRHYTGNEIS